MLGAATFEEADDYEVAQAFQMLSIAELLAAGLIDERTMAELSEPWGTALENAA